MKLTTDGIEVNYEKYGEGSPCDGVCALVLEGWNTNTEVYVSVARLLSEKYTVIVPDLPGFGLTPEPPEAWDTAAYADFIAHFLSSLGVRRVLLWGHSFGGRLIIRLASRTDLPFTIDKIVLTDAAGIRPKKSLYKRLRQRSFKLLRSVYSTKFFRYFYPDALAELRRSHGSADYNSATPLMRNVLVKSVNEDLTPLLTSVSAPSLLIWGDKDTATPLSDGRLMEKMIPDAGLAVIEGAGHYSFLDKPALYASILKAFI